MKPIDFKHTVKFLISQQQADGGFIGGASTSTTDFQSQRQHPTTFFTSLILSCLQDIPNTDKLRKQAVDFLLKQKSSQWSWNYWQRDSDMAKSFPYPDDLDDTACACIALGRYDNKLINGEALANVAKLLIATETTPGGPYRTWLVTPDLQKRWGDVDCAVNANIGRLLASQKIQLPGLNQYIDQAIRRHKLSSPYYVGVIPILYFLAPWYQGKELPQLRQLINKELVKSSTQNSLMLALCISAGCKLGLSQVLIQPAIDRLLSLKQRDHWPAEALYVDPKIEGTAYYAGSETLTTAFVLEAFINYQASLVSPAKQSNEPLSHAAVKQALAESHKLPTASLRQQYGAAVRKLAGNKSQRITDIAHLTAEAYNKHPEDAELSHLNLASLNGWVAYTIYDDFLDDEGQPAQLGAANVALRKTIHHFRGALPHDQQFQRLVQETLDIVDAANTWEVTHARARYTNESNLVYTLPNYGSYRQLAERSWGHMLAAGGTLLTLGFTVDDSEFRHLQRFFQHFLIARQLNDDAHDWENDLVQGHLSAVVTMLLADQGLLRSCDLTTNRDSLRLQFWQETIARVVTLINRHVLLARRALRGCGMQKPQLFAVWLDSLQAAAEAALTGSRETQQFIQAY